MTAHSPGYPGQNSRCRGALLGATTLYSLPIHAGGVKREWGVYCCTCKARAVSGHREAGARNAEKDGGFTCSCEFTNWHLLVAAILAFKRPVDFQVGYTSDNAGAGSGSRAVEAVRGYTTAVDCAAAPLCDSQCGGVAQYAVWKSRCRAEGAGEGRAGGG